MTHNRRITRLTVGRFSRYLWYPAYKETDGTEPMLICHDQPKPLPPLKLGHYEERPSTGSSFAPSYWLAEGRGLVSRASSRASFSGRGSMARRPTISNPSDFRRVHIPTGRRESFKPLELSIYLPGNRLSPLPIFCESSGDGFVEPTYPANALIRARSDSLIYRPSTGFTIPRKPVASISEVSSMSESRLSIDARLARCSMSTHSRSHSLRLGCSDLDSESTKEFLAALDTRLPKSPSPLRTRSSTEPGFTIHRRASEQSLRQRTHLEERQEIERRLRDIDTIVEEKPSNDQDLGPRLPFVTYKALDNSTLSAKPKCARSSTLSDFRMQMERPLPRTPLTFNQPNPAKQPPPPPPPPKSTPRSKLHDEISPTDQLASESSQQQRTSTRSRVSQWLFRWTPEQSRPATVVVSLAEQPFYQCSTSVDGSHAPTGSTVSSTSDPFDDSLAPTVATTSNSVHYSTALPPYQACPPYQKYDPKVGTPSELVHSGIEVGVAV